MRGYVGLAFSIIPLLILIMFIPDLIVYGVLNYKATNLTEVATKEIEIEGGTTAQAVAEIDKRMNEYGLMNKGLKVNYSHQGEIQRGDRFSVEITGKYTFRTFNLLGTGVGNFSLPIHSVDSGFSEILFR